MPNETKEWDAGTYHAVSEPQYAWGTRVLDRLTLVGDETVVDAGCGTGRLTAKLAARLPSGRVLAVDASRQMLAEARRHLAAFANRVDFVEADIQTWSEPGAADGIFSTATFHWVRDHERLFVNLYNTLKSNGWLRAQCGGEGNLAAFHERVEEVQKRPEYEAAFTSWEEPWEFAGADETRKRLVRAGFADIDTALELAPTAFGDADQFSDFIKTVVLRPHLAALGDAERQATFLRDVVSHVHATTGAFSLDYVRLNIRATKKL